MLTGCNIRVEHWVVAERQGQTAALNMLGHRTAFSAVPYFWSQHYDVPINYVGHAEKWDEIAIEGDIAARDCAIRFKRDGRTQAIASISKDYESLQEELSMERHVADRVSSRRVLLACLIVQKTPVRFDLIMVRRRSILCIKQEC